jgi:hypothetical protein
MSLILMTLKKLDEGQLEDRARGKKVLDICLYRNVLSAHGTSSYNVGRFQRGGRASPARDSKLPCDRRTTRGRHRAHPATRATVGIQASAGVAGRGARPSAARRTAYALSNQRRGNPTGLRLDENLRTLLVAPIESRQGASGRCNQAGQSRSKQIRRNHGFHSDES